ncbi:Serine phosphatase RsbU, regulator of sigma subunit [Lishizhenia tianjinensis]|uniref:Serine phosphatase RsbU, regulator of sigma subunit n=1 Tax=Lishizhenia tianjinensis TaxID=477690 RepID=A0A1I7BKV9_9FLAO|nr:7TM diverse intracellular signaling domain-containing protein [Lishizhenia tianjinensis]SFT87820.1 Serine phosphatase RsbU, regulator of sigma subunit [Lishizhenia tianjinensis]
MKISRSILLLLLPILVVLVFSSSKEPTSHDLSSIEYFTTNSDEISQLIEQEQLYISYAKNDHINLDDDFIWLKIDGRLFKNNKYIKILNKLTPRIEQYKKIDKGYILIDSSGYNIPCKQRSLCHQHFILNIYPEINYYRIYNPDIITNLRLNLLNKSSLISDNLKEQMGFGIYYGVFLFFITLNTFLFIQLKDNAYLFNISFTFLLALSFALYDGNFSSSIFSSISINTYVISRVLFHILLLNHLIFAYSFFGIVKRKSYWKKTFIALFVLQGLLILLSTSPWRNLDLVLNYVSIYNFFIQVIIVSVLIIQALIKPRNVNQKYLIAYFPVITLVIAYLLKISGLSFLKFNFNDILYTCLSTLVVLLAIYIIDAFSSYREDAEKRLKEMTKIKNHNNLNLENKINQETLYLQEQQKQLEIKNKELLDSFHYAKRIQNSLLTNEATIQSVFPDSFLIFQPKEILSTDFYWVTQVSTKNNPNLVLFCIGKPDQTGIPGTLINAIILKTIRNSIHSQKLSNTARVINYIQHRLDVVLAKNGVNAKNSLMVGVYNKTNHHLSFSGNIEMLEIMRNGKPLDKHKYIHQTEEYKGSYISQEHGIDLEENDEIYLFTEGIESALNTKGKHYFLQLLMSLSTAPISFQKDEMLREVAALKIDQHKDLTLIGFKI